MTHRNVETLLGRLLTDAGLRRRFSNDPTAVLEEFRTQGYELTLVELDALVATDPAVLRSVADTLDRRLCRVDVPSRPDAQDE
jgi:hypothetical protein